jgi:hypothetical protein
LNISTALSGTRQWFAMIASRDGVKKSLHRTGM